ncbi:unnamed protein product [Boreogadus saida]
MAFPEPEYRGVLRRHLLHQLCFQADEVFDWKKEQQEVFFYEKAKDYNNQGREGQDPQFVGRVRLLPGGLQAGKASMILSSVTQADSGVHKCILLLPTRQTDPADSRVLGRGVGVGSRPGQRGRCWVRVLGRGVGVGSRPGQRAVEPQLRPEVEEASPSSGWVRLSCLSSGGQPQPSGLEWQTPNGTVIPAEEAPPAASSDGDGRYSISQTVEVTEPGNYTCLARQQGVHPAVRGTIRVVGHREEDLGNGTWAAIGVVLSIRTFGLNLYNFIKNKNRSKDGQQALPDADSLD